MKLAISDRGSTAVGLRAALWVKKQPNGVVVSHSCSLFTYCSKPFNVTEVKIWSCLQYLPSYTKDH